MKYDFFVISQLILLVGYVSLLVIGIIDTWQWNKEKKLLDTLIKAKRMDSITSEQLKQLEGMLKWLNNKN